MPLEQSDWFVSKAKSSKQPVVYHQLADYAHGPAWTRKIMADQLGYIEDYLLHDCGRSGGTAVLLIANVTVKQVDATHKQYTVTLTINGKTQTFTFPSDN